jgi:hypothetical protein
METSRRAVDQSLVAKVVSSYVKKNRLPPEEMPTLITTVYQSLLALEKPPELEPPTPAVPVRRSVTRNYVVCLECGWQGHTLRRHIQAKHGLSADKYRTVEATIASCLGCPGLFGEAIRDGEAHARKTFPLPSQPDQDGGADEPGQTRPLIPLHLLYKARTASEAPGGAIT